VLEDNTVSNYIVCLRYSYNLVINITTHSSSHLIPVELVWSYSMSDKKTDIANNDIYNRFVTRAQSTEGDGHADNDTQARLDLIATETADTETVFDFSNQSAFVEGAFDTDELLEMGSNDSQLDSDHNSIMDSKADVPSDPEATIYDDWATQEAQIQEMVSEPTATAQKKLTSSKKPLITGMIFGSLLIAIIVAVLIFTGILSTSSNTTVPDNASSNPNSNIETKATTDSTQAEDIAAETSMDESKPEVESSAIETPVAAVQQGESTGKSQSSTTNDAEVAEASESASKSEAASNESQADTTISYEMFREESQNTLYRETND